MRKRATNMLLRLAPLSTRAFLVLALSLSTSTITGCGTEESAKCTHCWLYAGMTLTEGNIDAGFQRAEDIYYSAPDQCPDVAGISKAIIRNEIDSLIYIKNPEPDDFKLCHKATCAVFYMASKDIGHFAVFDYETGMLFDNCRCWHGCDNFKDHDYLELYIAWRKGPNDRSR